VSVIPALRRRKQAAPKFRDGIGYLSRPYLIHNTTKQTNRGKRS
jgi:hypothetical protein